MKDLSKFRVCCKRLSSIYSQREALEDKMHVGYAVPVGCLLVAIAIVTAAGHLVTTAQLCSVRKEMFNRLQNWH